MSKTKGARNVPLYEETRKDFLDECVDEIFGLLIQERHPEALAGMNVEQKKRFLVALRKVSQEIADSAHREGGLDHARSLRGESRCFSTNNSLVAGALRTYYILG